MKKDRGPRSFNEERLSALEEKLSLKTIEQIFVARRQIREGKTVSLDRLEGVATKPARA